MMKYGLLTYFGSSYCNFGDYVQSLAIEYLYLEVLKIPKDQIIYMSQEELKSYDGEPMVLPYSYVLAFLLDAGHKKAEISEKITVVFLGASLEFATLYDAYPIENFLAKSRGYHDLFLRYSPIGCRDNFTKEFLQNAGISAYLQGCITNIFPFREEKEYKKVLLIDVPAEILRKLPDDILQNAEILSNASDLADLSYKENFERIRRQYAYYRDHAALIVSSRYHVVTPCNAMGIPCIFIKRTLDKHVKDIRLDSLHPEIQVVWDDDFSAIDFNKKVERSKEFYALKQRIETLACSRIQTAAVLQENARYIYEFFKPRIDWFTQMPNADVSYKKRLSVYIRKYHGTSKGKYFIWGAIKLLCDGDTVGLVKLIEEVNPDLEFSGWIDTYKTGFLAKRPIYSPGDFELRERDFVVVAAETAASSALKCFSERGYGKERYLILANMMATQDDVEAQLKERAARS